MRHACLLLLPLLGGVLSCSSPPESATKEVRSTPEFEWRLEDLSGATLDLQADLAQGKKIALVYWQTWCKSCRSEAPELVEAYRQHSDAFRFVGIVPGGTDVVDPASIRETAADWGLAWPQVQDTTLALTNAYRVEGTPTILVLGEGGKVLYRGVHPPDWSSLR